MSKDELISAVLALPPREREDFLDEVWRSLDGNSRDEIEAAWADEIRQRLEAHERGTLTSKPIEEVVERMRARLRP